MACGLTQTSGHVRLKAGVLRGRIAPLSIHSAPPRSRDLTPTPLPLAAWHVARSPARPTRNWSVEERARVVVGAAAVEGEERGNLEVPPGDRCVRS